MQSIVLNKRKKEKNIQRNQGIDILRMLLCFRIVLLHCYTSKDRFINKLRRNLYQVTCFFFISFIYLYPTLSSRNIEKMKLRLERLSIPYIIYPITFWIIENLMFLLFKFNRLNRFLTFTELKSHITIGRGISDLSILWFLFHLQIITIFFFIFSLLLKKHFLLVFQTFCLLCYQMQYTGINYNFFNQYTNNVFTSIGNFIETVPVATLAFSLSKINFIKMISNEKMKIIFFFSFFFYFICEYNIFHQIKGMASPGLKPLSISFLLFSIFSLLPLNFINSKILIAIGQMTKYTMGIYCMHRMVNSNLIYYFGKTVTFFGCITIYIICYFISFIGFHIFSKNKLRFLFI